jgi:hypothetical protein
LGKYLKAGISIVGLVSCLGLLFLVLENHETIFSIGSTISGAFDKEEALAQDNYSRKQEVTADNVADRAKLITTEDTPLELRFDDLTTGYGAVASYGIAAYPSHGRLGLNLSLNGGTYFPDADFNGSDSFALELIRGIGDAVQIRYEISITPISDSPTANDDSIVIREDSKIEIKVLDNDYDVDGDSVTIISISSSHGGTAKISDVKQTIIYEPRQDNTDDDNFSYTIVDTVGEKSTANVFITIEPVNDKPIAEDDFVVTNEDIAVAIRAISNDLDEDSRELVILSATDPSNGSTRISGSGDTITYYPATNFYGADEFKYTVSDGSLTDTATIRVVVEPVNDYPVANAGHDLEVKENSKVILDASASFDPDGSIVSYRWEQLGNSQPSVDLLDEHDGKIIEFIARNVTTTINFTFRLTVVDDDGTSNTDEIEIAITNINRAPTANAGADLRAAEGDLILLNGSRSLDPDRDRLTYSWKQEGGPPAHLLDDDSANPSIRIPSLGSEDVTLTFILRVEDANGGTDEDAVKIFVRALDQPPVADARGIDSVNEGDLVQLDGTNSFDPDGDSLTYSWKQSDGPAVSLSGPNSAKPTFTAPYDLDEDENLVFELKVSDGSFTSTDKVAITVKDTIGAPKILGTPQYLEDLLYEIGQAKEVVYASTYYVEDYPNNGLLDALENATKRGVDVRLMFAGPTLTLYPDVDESLTSRGIAYKIVSDNHAKVAVIDDKIAYVGSANWNKNGLQNNWELSIKSSNPDTVKEVKGFVETMWRTGSKVVRYYDYPEEQFVNGHEFYELLLQNIRDANKIKVLMFEATYTFGDSSAPDSKLLDEIKNANERGADLQLLFDDPKYYEIYGGKQFLTKNNIPHKLDDKTTGNLQRIHAKAVLIDDKILIIGSHNWNRDSLDSSSEASIITRNPDTISAFLNIFEQKWNAGHYVVGG